MSKAIHQRGADRAEIRIGAFVPYPPDRAPSQRFRMEQWTPLLQQQGIAVELLPFADERLMEILHKPGRRLRKATALARAFVQNSLRAVRCRQYDVILIHRAMSLVGPALLERIAAASGRPVIFDFDDAIYLLHTSGGNRLAGWMKCPGKTAAICRLSRHVVAGNAHLAAYARQHNSQVTVIPSSVDTDRYHPRRRTQKAASNRVVVGWTGSSTSQTYLELFAPILARIAARPEVELRIHSDREPDLPGIRFVWRRWDHATELDELAAFDIGLMPMPDTAWASGKCAMKALLYMALGIPALCSSVGMNAELIQDGQNGLLAATPDGWLHQIDRLIADADLRRQLGAAGRQTVERHYSARHCARQLGSVIRQAVDGVPAAADHAVLDSLNPTAFDPEAVSPRANAPNSRTAALAALQGTDHGLTMDLTS